MLWLSELMMQRHDLESFEGLIKAIEERARQGERFFSMDVKPPYPDTPDHWEERLEAIFTSVRS